MDNLSLVSKIINICRWPENKNTGRRPWFIILRRLIFWPLLLTAVILGWLSIFEAYGLKEANRWWKIAS